MPTRHALRQRLEAGEFCAGPFLKIPDPAITELAGIAGFDFVVVDLEHSAFSMETAVGMVRAAALREIDAVIRVSSPDPAELSRALDTGASGVIVPQVTSPEAAREVVAHTRFHPLGRRGMDLYARAADWGGVARPDYLADANERVLVAAMVEGADAFEQLPAIAAVEGLDLLFVGPYDLSQSLGLPGEIDHPRVLARIEEGVGLARSHGRALGIYVDDLPTALRYRDLGVQFVGMANDADLLRRRFGDLATALQAAPLAVEA